MDVKALIFDIDGTLFTSQGVMNNATFNALLACKRDGLILCMATARSGRIVFRDHEIPGDKNLLLECGIFYNGATVYDQIHHFYQHTPLSGALVHEIVDAIHHYDDGLQIALQHDDIYHAFKYPMPAQELANWGFSGAEIHDFDVSKRKPVTKIMVFRGTSWQDIAEDMSGLYTVLMSVFSTQANIILADSKKSIYIVSKHASKGNAISKLISLYDIQPQEVAVFGDDTPDIGMFGLFGHSIAMGNAHAALRAISTYVTLTNDQDGVVYALKNYLKVL